MKAAEEKMKNSIMKVGKKLTLWKKRMAQQRMEEEKKRTEKRPKKNEKR